MTRLFQNVVRACGQSIYTEKGISHWVKEGGKGFESLDFSLVLSEYHCIERSIRHLRIRFYSKNEEVFYPIKTMNGSFSSQTLCPGLYSRRYVNNKRH
jgi:hypothetical protein